MAQDPFLSINPVVSSLEAHRGRIAQTAENSARQAFCYAEIATHGVGQVQHLEVVPFDCTFIEEPNVAYGFKIDGDTLVDNYFPNCSGGVWKWQQDRRGYYLGAYVFFVISGDPGYDLEHNFTFSGIAIKDLPEYLLDK